MKTVSYIAEQCLACGECGEEVIVCVDSALTEFGLPYVRASIANMQTGLSNCGAIEYTYDFTYNEYDLADPLTPLVTDDINGVFCAGCITDYIDGALTAAFAAILGNFCIVVNEEQFVNALASEDCTHIFVAIGFALTDDRVLPEGKSLTQVNGAYIVTGGHTLTINGNISSGAYPLFSAATGEVVFNSGAELAVEWFGAVGDGSTNDQEPIQEALTAITAAGGGTVKLHPGKTYSIGSELVIGPTSVDLTLSGYGAKIKGDTNSNVLRISNEPGGSGNPVNVVCKGFSIEGSLVDNPSYTSQVGILIYSVDGLVLQDLKITDIAGTGIRGYKSATGSPNVWKQVKWDHIVVEDCGGMCAYITNPSADPCDELLIIGSRFSGAGQLLSAGVAAGGSVDLEVMTIGISGSEFSENYSTSVAGAYQYGLAVRNACGTMTANVFRNNCKNLADTADLLLNSDVQGIVVQSQSHYGNSLNAAQDAIYVLGEGCVLNVIRYESGGTRQYRRIVNSLDGSDVKLLHVGPLIDTLGVGVTDTPVAYLGEEGRESLLIHDGILRTPRRRENLYTLARRLDFTITGWGAGAAVNGGSIAKFEACDSHGVVEVNTDTAVGATNPCRVQFDHNSTVDWPAAPTVLVQLIDTDDAAVQGTAVPIRIVSSTTNFYFDVYMNPAASKYYKFAYQVVGV